MDNTEVEARLLSACLLYPPRIREIAAEVRPEEFTYPPYRALYVAMVAAGERSEGFDDSTLLRRLIKAGMDESRAADTVMRVLGAHTDPWAVAEYVDLVHEEGRWRCSPSSPVAAGRMTPSRSGWPCSTAWRASTATTCRRRGVG